MVAPSLIPRKPKARPPEGSRGGRRRWTDGEKKRIVAESEAPGSSDSIVARRYDLNANMLFTRRRGLQQREAGADFDQAAFIPAIIAAGEVGAGLPAAAPRERRTSVEDGSGQEQRISRIKRFGQTRGEVDVLNLVYRESWDEQVLSRLSARLKDRYDLFGGLPDVIDDDWIEDIEDYERYLDSLIDAAPDANAFELRYVQTMEPEGEDWALCAEVLSRIEVEKALARPW